MSLKREPLADQAKSRHCLPIASIVAPFWGSDLESYKVTPKRNYYGAYGYILHRVLTSCVNRPPTFESFRQCGTMEIEDPWHGDENGS